MRLLKRASKTAENLLESTDKTLNKGLQATGNVADIVANVTGEMVDSTTSDRMEERINSAIKISESEAKYREILKSQGLSDEDINAKIQSLYNGL